MKKNAFYFILKAIFFLKMSKFLSWLFGHTENRPWDKVDFKIYEVTGWQTITMHILPNISQRKGKQAITFGQLIEFYKRNIFLQKIIQKMTQGD